MRKYILVPFFFLYFSFAIAEQSDPCSLTSLPIIKEMEVKHAESIEMPSIFLLYNNAKISVSNNEIIRYVNEVSSPHIPHLQASTELLKQQLLNQTELEKSLSAFEPDPNSQKGADFQIAVNIYGFVSGAIQKSLFDSKALVVYNQTKVSTSLVRLRVGEVPDPVDEFNKVHILNFISNGIIVYESCWLDR